MLVRLATRNDARTIAAIHVAGWRAAYRGLMPEAVLDALDVEARGEFWQRLLAEPHRTLVAESASVVVGFCSVVASRDADADPAAVAEIAAIYVSPMQWRRGVGSALCGAAFRLAAEAGFSVITLWVLATNEPAISFYQAHGFTDDGAVRTEVLSDGSAVREVRLRLALA
jgi:ribosomal protein S18 acetylase RimI-like enzyme